MKKDLILTPKPKKDLILKRKFNIVPKTSPERMNTAQVALNNMKDRKT